MDEYFTENSSEQLLEANLGEKRTFRTIVVVVMMT